MQGAIRRTLILAVALTTLSLSAHADPPPTDAPAATVSPVDVPHPPPPPVRRPWIRRPTGQDMADYYPLHAEQAHINGHVTLVCKVAADGRLAACKATDVAPTGENFDWASLKLVPYFQLDVTPKGDPTLVGTVISIPIGWVMWR
jgi:hypothetical protein